MALAAALLILSEGWVAMLAAKADGGERNCHETAVSAAIAKVAEPGATTHRLFLPELARGETPGTHTPSNDQPVPAGFKALQERLAAAVGDYEMEGTYAIAVTDLQTGHTIGVDAARAQRSGCIMNLFVIVQTLRDVQAGMYAIEAVDGLMRQTIWASDATTANELYRIAGSGDVLEGVRRVERLLHETLNLPAIVIDHPPAYPETTLGLSDDNWATAEAMNAALAALYHGELLNPEWTAYLIEAMQAVKPGLNYLTANLPEDAVVSHKNGFFWADDGYVDNDTAIVQFERSGRWYAYAITFMSETVPGKYDDIWLGRDLVRMSWEYFTTEYR